MWTTPLPIIFFFLFFCRTIFKSLRRSVGRKMFWHHAINSVRSLKLPVALMNKRQAERKSTNMWINLKHTKVRQIYVQSPCLKRDLLNNSRDQGVWLQRVFLFFLVFKYGPLSAGSSKKHGHTITHNSHQSLSIFRWDFSFVSIEGRLGGWRGGGGAWSAASTFRSSEQESCCTPHNHFFSLRTFVAFSDTDICT